MNPRHAVIAAVLLVVPVVAGGDHVPASSPENTPALTQGMVVTVDPSGKFVPGPQATDLRAGLGDAISTSAAGLVEEKSTVPGGGVMVDLQGRFQNAMVIETDASGNVAAPCISGTPEEVK